MPPKPLVLASLLCFYSTFLTFPRSALPPPPSSTISPSSSSCDLFRGKWVYNLSRPKPSYDETCPFHRNSWNCIKNGKPDMRKVNSWEWIPKGCDLERFDARGFLGSMRGRNVGLVGDSLSDNLVVALLCALRSGDERGRKWKKAAWRVWLPPGVQCHVGYHRALLLAKYWHFYGGEWNQNGSCLFKEPLKESQLDAWYDPNNNGVNREARRLNDLITRVLRGSDIQALDFTHLSEFRADAHPAIWLGKKDAVAIWGQDCMHWCLSGVPDTWVDILAQLICQSTKTGDRVYD